MEPIKPMNIVKQGELADEVLRLTDPGQQKRMLKDCLLLFNTKAVKWMVRAYIDLEWDGKELKKLLKDPEREDKLIALVKAEELKDLLNDCLCGLTSPEFKRLLYPFVKEIPDFNRLIREAGGRTVVPYEID